MPTSATTITVPTTRFGEIEVEQQFIIDFPKGILGFEDKHHFVLIDQPEYSPFMHLQSLDDPSLAFTVVNPRLVFPHYKVQIDRQEIVELDARNLDDIITWVIVTVPADATRMSANLQGPVLVNRQNNRGKQVVLVRSPYTTRHYLMDEITKNATPKKAGVMESSRA